jgi:hypothetical protein
LRVVQLAAAKTTAHDSEHQRTAMNTSEKQ